jgi:hypothetical protein
MRFILPLSIYKTIDIELDLGRHAGEWIAFHLHTRSQQDNPGFRFSFDFLTLIHFHFWLCDTRYWDHERKLYVFPQENEEGEHR